MIDTIPLPHVLILGGGFAGLSAAKILGASKKVRVTLLDKRNHHLFQPLLYQVATAGLSPAEIAFPIRSILSTYPQVSVFLEEALSIDPKEKTVTCSQNRTFSYDYLMLACGASHSYFGHPEWEPFAPGLKTLEQATEIRKRILLAFEEAEKQKDMDEVKKNLTFLIVGGGPTGVEMAGSIAELSRVTLSKDFRNIDPSQSRIILVEAGPRILPMFSEDLSARAALDLESMGVQIWTSNKVTQIDESGVTLGKDFIASKNVFWAAGVQASSLSKFLGTELEKNGKVMVTSNLTVAEHPSIYVLGDMSSISPGLAPAATQQGNYAAKHLLEKLEGRTYKSFRYLDKGMMATIGRSRAVLESKGLKMKGFIAWVAWLVVHIYFLMGFKNRLFVFISWTWSYLTYKRGARLITETPALQRKE